MAKEKKHVSLSRNPQNISDKLWYYEETSHVEIIYNPTPGVYHHLKIPWGKLMKSVDRYIRVRHERQKRRGK